MSENSSVSCNRQIHFSTHRHFQKLLKLWSSIEFLLGFFFQLWETCERQRCVKNERQVPTRYAEWFQFWFSKQKQHSWLQKHPHELMGWACSRPHFANRHVFKGEMLLQKLRACLDWQDVLRNRERRKHAAKSQQPERKNSKVIHKREQKHRVLLLSQELKIHTMSSAATTVLVKALQIQC